MEVGLGSADFVFDGDPTPTQKEGHSPHPIFGPSLLWRNGWMNQDASSYRGKPRPRRRCVRWGLSSPLKGTQPPVFGSCLMWQNDWMDGDATWYGSRPRPRPHCVRRGPSSPRERDIAAPPLFSARLYCGHGRQSQLLLSSCEIGLWACGYQPINEWKGKGLLPWQPILGINSGIA